MQKLPPKKHREMSPGIRVTDHAILRYMQRVETSCTRREAIDRLLHAMKISVPASKRHVRQMHSHRGRREPAMRHCTFRYCAVASLMLVVVPKPMHMLVVSVMRIEP